MPTDVATRDDTLTPTAADAARAGDLGRRLLAELNGQPGLRLQILDGGGGEPLAVPAAVVRLVADALAVVAAGRPVTIIPEDAELTPSQVSHLLGLSRPHVIGLIHGGDLPVRPGLLGDVVRYGDLRAYAAKRAAETETALAEMTREAQEMGLYE